MNDFRDYNDYLMHYGVKGMHWGIRRYQPYPSGKTGIFKNLKEKKEERRKAYIEKNKQKILKNPKKVNKYYDYLTDEEINKAKKIKRDKQELSTGKKALYTVLTAAATAALVEVIKETTKLKTKDVLKAMSNSKIVNVLKNDMKNTFNSIKADAVKTFNELRANKAVEEFHQMTIDELMATLK